MIELHTFSTPNGRKASIALEEMELPYTVYPVNIMEDEQFDPAFLAISPNNKIPAIVDGERELSLMESGAILFYLATKTGKFLPADPHEYWQCMEWLFWQVGGYGPMLGQANHFLTFNRGKSDYAEERYGTEAARLYRVLDTHLGANEYLAGSEYSIADMATWPWTASFKMQNVDLADYPNVRRWYLAIAERPAVQRGYNVPTDAEIPTP